MSFICAKNMIYFEGIDWGQHEKNTEFSTKVQIGKPGFYCEKYILLFFFVQFSPEKHNNYNTCVSVIFLQ